MEKHIIKNPFYIDVDDTLIMWDLSKYQDTHRADFITIGIHGYESIVLPNQKNINLLVKFAKLGYDIIVHSQTGWEHAKEVVEKLNLTEYVDYYGDKPKYILDDIPPSGWTQRLWRDPITGKEEGA